MFDWLFGTLYVPARNREPLTFGVEGETHEVHSFAGSLLTPIAKAVDLFEKGLPRLRGS